MFAVDLLRHPGWTLKSVDYLPALPESITATQMRADCDLISPNYSCRGHIIR
jgi:hypothetical protein